MAIIDDIRVRQTFDPENGYKFEILTDEKEVARKAFIDATEITEILKKSKKLKTSFSSGGITIPEEACVESKIVKYDILFSKIPLAAHGNLIPLVYAYVWEPDMAQYTGIPVSTYAKSSFRIIERRNPAKSSIGNGVASDNVSYKADILCSVEVLENVDRIAFLLVSENQSPPGDKLVEIPAFNPLTQRFIYANLNKEGTTIVKIEEV